MKTMTLVYQTLQNLLKNYNEMPTNILKPTKHSE